MFVNFKIWYFRVALKASSLLVQQQKSSPPTGLIVHIRNIQPGVVSLTRFIHTFVTQMVALSTILEAVTLSAAVSLLCSSHVMFEL